MDSCRKVKRENLHKSPAGKDASRALALLRGNLFITLAPVAVLLFLIVQVSPRLLSTVFEVSVSVFLIMICASLVLYLILRQPFRTITHLESQVRQLDQANQGLVEDVSVLRSELRDARAETIERSRTLAAASHDLRQPLQSIGLLLYSLENRLEEPDVKAMIADIERSYQSMSDLFGSLLEISQIDSNAVDVDRCAFPLNETLDVLKGELLPIASKKGLVLDLGSADVVVYSDQVLLARILRNLLHNAVVHTQKGEVKLRFDVSHHAVTLMISDTGPGIPQSELGNVFSEFYQLRRHGEHREGVGLGLSIVGRLCRLLGHDVSVTSVVGQGSIFQVRVALAEHLDGPLSKFVSAPFKDDLNGLQLLLIDDDSINLQMISSLLRSWGCIVYKARDLTEATSVVRAHESLAFILIDYHLGAAKNGVRLFGQLNRMRGRLLPGLLITGDRSTGVLREAQAAGLQVLPKPIQPARLRGAINRSLCVAKFTMARRQQHSGFGSR